MTTKATARIVREPWLERAPTYEHPGMAPQAFLVGVKVLDAGGSGSFATVMAGMQWTVDHRYEFNIRAASMSLGGPGPIEWTSDEEDSVNRYANEMVRAGITMLIAAGNSFASAQIGTPGSAEDVITVGALDKNTAIAVYSSQGPTEEGRVKPNVAFVGSDVMSPSTTRRRVCGLQRHEHGHPWRGGNRRPDVAGKP